jgi:hypothetical protein
VVERREGGEKETLKADLLVVLVLLDEGTHPRSSGAELATCFLAHKRNHLLDVVHRLGVHIDQSFHVGFHQRAQTIGTVEDVIHGFALPARLIALLFILAEQEVTTEPEELFLNSCRKDQTQE